ncbi:hypothetical protein EW146_g7697 [Bondarzewia mesenterica]|uniref:Uncharacterized protein n=1 Tax=Bondarzewia mesenterica TaxID=1095465 RepID=A0A4S4LLV0_9AGAM|nr:hypothetical protein EW146_g7697 [Bondarzewia mesenterica]
MATHAQKRSLTTYSRRKDGACSLHVVTPDSSPLKVVDREDLSLAEMSHRMKKRARQATAALSNRQGPVDMERNLKRIKQASNAPADLESITLPTLLPHDYLVALTGGNDNFRDQFKTPANSQPSPNIATPAGRQNILPEQFSPLPIPRRVLSRTSSRKLKENFNSLARGLASPFNSRPGSTSGSPKKKESKKSLFMPKPMLASATQTEKFVHHTRFPSDPQAPTAYLLQQIDDETWFRPAKALSLSPFNDDALPPETPPPEWSFNTESFYRDVPQKTSTPLGKSPAGPTEDEGTPSAPNTPEMHVSKVAGDLVVDATSVMEQPRRRMIMHYSKNSIFSSSFVDDTTVLSSHQRSKSDADSQSSMSLTDILVSDIFLSRSVPGSSAGNISLENHLASEGIPTPCSSPIADELSRMLVDMGFDEHVQPWSPHSSLNRSRSLGSAVVPLETSAAQSRTQKEIGHRRNRAGTIRASDYAHISANNHVAPLITTATTTRTRSGTIRPTRPPMHGRINSEPMAVPTSAPATDDGMMSDDPIDFLQSPFMEDEAMIEDQEGRPIKRKNRMPPAVRRRVARIESMSMDVGSDESDDELLLVPGKSCVEH